MANDYSENHRQQESTRLPVVDASSPTGDYDYASQVEKAATVLLARIEQAIDSAGKRGDDFGGDVGVDAGQLSRALHGRGAHFSVKWLPAVLWRDHEHMVIRFLCSMAGGDFTPMPKRTRTDENEALRKYVEDRMGDHGQDVLRHALGENS